MPPTRDIASQSIAGIVRFVFLLERMATYLVICNHNQSVWEIQLDTTIFSSPEFTSYRSIATYPNHCWTPPLRCGRDIYSKGLLSEGHICIIQVLVIPIQRYSHELSNDNP